jgi:hypothetical protein
MRRTIVLLLAACGPSVSVDDDGGEDTSAETTTDDPGTASSPTSATTATTQPTTVATTVMGDDSASDPTTTDATEGEDDVGEEGSATFITRPDGGVCSCECDVWAQDCPRGAKCTAWANDGGDTWNSVRCSDLDPTPMPVGASCVAQDSPVSGFDDCDLGAFCWDVDPVTLEGTCVPLCTGSEANPMCADGSSCYYAFDGVLNLCLPSCDPLAPNCSEDEVCASEGYGVFFSLFVCLPTPRFEPQALGESCAEDFLVCDDGLACVEPEHVPGCAGLGCCTLVGELSQMPLCPDASQTCIPFDDTMPDTGLCYCGVES